MKTLRDQLARYMHPEAFHEQVPTGMKFVCKNMAKVRHDQLKAKRETANKRAAAAIRFFEKNPEHLASLNRRASLATNLPNEEEKEVGNGR